MSVEFSVQASKFPPHPIGKSLAPSFRMELSTGSISCTFTATGEYEIDAAITALIAVRHLLRRNVNPLPKQLALVPVTKE